MADDVSLAVQKAIRARLIGSAGVTTLVPATSILDRNERPEVFPCILLGEDQVVNDGSNMTRTLVTVFSNLHLWTREESFAGLKQIANAVRRALRLRLFIASDYHVGGDSVIRATRFLRDPGGEHGHAVLTVETVIQELWAFEI